MAELYPAPLKLKRKPKGSTPLLPEPSCQLTDLSKEQCCGVLEGGGVAVTRPQDIWALVKLGAYGKGVFSRSVPCHHHTSSLPQVCRKRKALLVEGEGEEGERSWRKRMKLHSQWKEAGFKEGSQESASKLPIATPLSTDKIEDESEQQDRLIPVHGEDPYPIDEYLQLGAEEAYYLATKLKVLKVTGAKELADTELWTHFACLDTSFPARYAAYAHYRAGNWVPKSGLKFGVDFTLYKDNPSSYHSSFAVVVKDEGGWEEEGASCKKGRDPLTWSEVIAQNRVSESSGKDLLICHASRCEETEKPDLEGVHKFMDIEDVIVQRWVPEQDRDM